MNRYLQIVCLSFLAGSSTLRPDESRHVPADRWSVKRLVEFHRERHRAVRVQDVYKMLYQANFGVEHLLADSVRVLSSILDELGSLDTTIAGEPLLERISTDDSVVRINLRPFIALNLRPDVLVHAMIQSARMTVPDTLRFFREWNEFSALVRYGMVHFPPREVAEWGQGIPAGTVSAVHHSRDYEKGNSPAYRVVRRDVFESLFHSRVMGDGTRETPGEL